ncbi:MAG: hypothetical protein LBI10_10385 [Deltaproteobacteria bacterium]|nr:hypothetical protein [Deltaproteobacteria bacterium]
MFLKFEGQIFKPKIGPKKDNHNLQFQELLEGEVNFPTRVFSDELGIIYQLKYTSKVKPDPPPIIWKLDLSLALELDAKAKREAVILSLFGETIAIVHSNCDSLTEFAENVSLKLAFGQLNAEEKAFIWDAYQFPESAELERRGRLNWPGSRLANVLKKLRQKFKASTTEQLAFKLFANKPLIGPSPLLSKDANELFQFRARGLTYGKAVKELNPRQSDYKAFKSEIETVFKSREPFEIVKRYLASSDNLKCPSTLSKDLGPESAVE